MKCKTRIAASIVSAAATVGAVAWPAAAATINTYMLGFRAGDSSGHWSDKQHWIWDLDQTGESWTSPSADVYYFEVRQIWNQENQACTINCVIDANPVTITY